MDWLRPVDADWNAPEAEDEASFCRHCGKALQGTAAYVRHYCSVRCRHHAWRAHMRDIGPPCPVCGGNVELRPDRKMIFCSSACYGESIRRAPVLGKERRCDQCGDTFNTRDRTERQRFCSRGCAQNSLRGVAKKEPWQRLPTREQRRAAARAGRHCKRCGNPFDAKRNDQWHCSPTCQKGAWQERKRANG